MTKRQPLPAFGPGARGAGPGAHNSNHCPEAMAPTLEEAAQAVAELRGLIPHVVPFRVPVGFKGDQFPYEVEAVAKAAWSFLEDSQIPGLWPYCDHVRFNPGDRARFLRALAVLDLWTFRPIGRR